MGFFNKIFLVIILTGTAAQACCQIERVDSVRYKTIIAGAEYDRSSSFQHLWGTNRRKEWTTPVTVPYFWLDSVAGGLKIYKGGGGGNETKSLRLRSAAGKEYVLRSINKSRQEVIPEAVKGTFIENVIQDGVSMSHPYGAFALAKMQSAAGIYHTNPLLVYLPEQKSLDSFNRFFANDLYMFEERPDEDWSEASHLGGFHNYSGTDKVIEDLLEDMHNTANQFAFAKTRLFDILIGDWDRHADNFRWGRKDSLGYKWYEPVPRDRDQTFFTHDGIFIDRLIKLGGYGFMKQFKEKVDDVDEVPGQQKDMDLFFTNALSKDQWMQAAAYLQQALTDSIIDVSLKGMPENIYEVSGAEILQKIISRRSQLQDIAAKYYLFLAKEVNIPLSGKSEIVKITSPAQDQVMIQVFDSMAQGTSQTLLYERLFKDDETERINIYGIDGSDTYQVEENLTDIKINIFGGQGFDSVIQRGGKNIVVYDSGSNFVQLTNGALKSLGKEKLPVYQFRSVPKIRSKIGFTPYLFYSENELYKRAVGLSAKIAFPNKSGKWQPSLSAYFTPVKWNNYYGLGNESDKTDNSLCYNQFTSTEWGGNAGLSIKTGNAYFGLFGFYHWSKSRQDSSGFVYKTLGNDSAFRAYSYAGMKLSYAYTNLDNNVVPTNGLMIRTEAALIQQIQQEQFYQDYRAKLQAYLPLSKKISIAIKGGGQLIANNSTINNTQVFQHAIIGGPETLRGYTANRFWGKSAYFNQNEIRFITDLKTYLINAKIGFLLFADNGRVWLKGEKSDTIHTSYGGGVIFAPFYQLNCTVTYAVSSECNLLQIGLRTGL